MRCSPWIKDTMPVRPRKLNFAEALDRLSDELSLSREDVQSRALQRKVWVAEWHMPGCLSESRAIVLRKVDAIDAAIEFTGADGSDHINHYCKGIRAALSAPGTSNSFQHHTELFGTVVTTIECMTLSDLL